ncbi:MAG TPA: DUF4129 domain-containing protein [Candidatus Acidoferrales bacterium]|nr:DUF4129 domain-containing protein [Candidatus Acidoferrales bacterium]
MASFARAPGAATSQQLSLQEYIFELDKCSALLASSGNNPAVLRTLRMSLPSQWVVSAGNQTYTVSTDWLADGLARTETARHGDSTALEQTQQQIAAHRDAAQALAAPASPRTLDQSRAKLNHILDGREFQAIHGPTWFDLLRARVYDWISRFLEKLFGRFAGGRALGNVIAWIVIAFAALLLILWAVRASMRSSARPEMDLRGAAGAGKDSVFWLREARDSAARGDYRAAIHAAYWAAIACLEEIKALPEDRSRTPRESLRLIRRESAEYAPLTQLTRRFELVWYGYRSADSADWTDAMKQLETLGCLRSSTPAISAS